MAVEATMTGEARLAYTGISRLAALDEPCDIVFERCGNRLVNAVDIEWTARQRKLGLWTLTGLVVVEPGGLCAEVPLGPHHPWLNSGDTFIVPAGDIVVDSDGQVDVWWANVG